MTYRPYPRMPHIQWRPIPGGMFHVVDRQTGETSIVDEAGVHQFAADHSRGIGNAVHAVTSKLGMNRCAPCAKRQAWLNSLSRQRR